MKKPILVSFCEFYACLQGIAGMVTCVVLMSQGQALAGILTLVGSVIAAVLVLGLGQCIEYLAASAHHAERAANALERQSPCPAIETVPPAASVLPPKPKPRASVPIAFAGGE